MQTILITSKNAFNCLARLASGQTGIQLLKQRWSGLRALPNDLRAPRSYQFPRLPPPRSKRDGNGEEYIGGQPTCQDGSYRGFLCNVGRTAAGDFKGTHRHVGAMSTRRTGCKFITSPHWSPLLCCGSDRTVCHPTDSNCFLCWIKKRGDLVSLHRNGPLCSNHILTVSQKALCYLVAITHEVDTKFWDSFFRRLSF